MDKLWINQIIIIIIIIIIMGEHLLEWIHGRRSNGLRVSRKLIMVKAKCLYHETCDESEKDLFIASNG